MQNGTDASSTIASLSDTTSGLAYRGIFKGVLVPQDLIHYLGHVFPFALYGKFDKIQLRIYGGSVNFVTYLLIFRTNVMSQTAVMCHE